MKKNNDILDLLRRLHDAEKGISQSHNPFKDSIDIDDTFAEYIEDESDVQEESDVQKESDDPAERFAEFAAALAVKKLLSDAIRHGSSRYEGAMANIKESAKASLDADNLKYLELDDDNIIVMFPMRNCNPLVRIRFDTFSHSVRIELLHDFDSVKGAAAKNVAIKLMEITASLLHGRYFLDDDGDVLLVHSIDIAENATSLGNMAHLVRLLATTMDAHYLSIEEVIEG